MTSTAKTTVVNIHQEPCDVYIGRAGKGQTGYFGNEHPIYTEGKPWTECRICKCRHARGEGVQAYAKHFAIRIQNDPEYRRRIEQLKGKKLGCFCRPADGFKGRLMCHGQVIAAYLENCKPEEIQ